MLSTGAKSKSPSPLQGTQRTAYTHASTSTRREPYGVVHNGPSQYQLRRVADALKTFDI